MGKLIDTGKIRRCCLLLPEPAPEVVIELCNEIDVLRVELRSRNRNAWKDTEFYRDLWREMRAERDGLKEQLDPESIQHWDTMRTERDNAQANARVLAHAYWHDSSPPEHVVREALAYPVRTDGSKS